MKHTPRHRAPQPATNHSGRHRAQDSFTLQVWNGVLRAIGVIGGIDVVHEAAAWVLTSF